ncbi:DUF1615 domain-containing protein [Piscinibacter sp. XHJ-5]|uniref:DUF1615 domain-containing protein n=1 Tax=Piscinibacter sp. XHJ-5 TaxID=3037797 RepID=UPI002453493B|nr:DUF1615 domain-containing protein [Piscinibacter sp. XHJ-5]
MAAFIRQRCFAVVLGVLLLAACASREPAPEVPALRPAEARALIAELLPAQTADRGGWATDMYAALASLQIAATAPNICAVIGIVEQESGFRADPAVPGLAAIAWRQIEQRAERAGVPMLVVRGALQLSSPTGRSYSERIDNAKTERELSEIFEDFIGMVPMGTRLFSGWNPVRTGGPMQVSIEFAQRHAQARPYPYPVGGSIRREVFTRRGGLYFGVAHLLGYPASYDKPLYRFADFNAGHYASRNAALQNAISVASGIPLVLDGDLVRRDDEDRKPGQTETAARVLAQRLRMGESDIRHDLEQGDGETLERSTLYQRVFALADAVEGRALPRAVLPQIDLRSPKITRKLTTAWFANRVDERYRRCLARAG